MAGAHTCSQPALPERKDVGTLSTRPDRRTVSSRQVRRQVQGRPPRTPTPAGSRPGEYRAARVRLSGTRFNSRLTATMGIVLLVMLFLEGITVAFIGPLFSWHILIGLALIPPIAVKLASTMWRFSLYYLGDIRYRIAGPPAPLLRLVGPVVASSTVVLMVSGVMVWIKGPSAVPTWGLIHKAAFVVWFGVMAVHVLGHVLRALRAVRADMVPPTSSRYVPGAKMRQLGAVATVVFGLLIGLVAQGAVSGWGAWVKLHP